MSLRTKIQYIKNKTEKMSLVLQTLIADSKPDFNASIVKIIYSSLNISVNKLISFRPTRETYNVAGKK
jgi:hypothetical protein